MKRVILSTSNVSTDDIEWLLDSYGFNYSNNQWELYITQYKKAILNIHDNLNISLTVSDKKFNRFVNVSGFETVLRYLDKLMPSVFACLKSLNETNHNIFAATNSRDLASNLVRVKSSNLWAYGMAMKDRKDKQGDLVIQFKGRRGGPGDIYVYYNVPLVVWKKLVSAPSKGHAFWYLIRNNFTYRKLTGDKKTHLKNGL